MWKQKLKKFLLLVLILGLGGSLFCAQKTFAGTGTNQQLAFEGKLVAADGTNIANGTYNLEFKIYNGGTATGGGTLQWTEDELVGGTGGVSVTNGTFEINLGANTALSAVNWNSDTLWLSLQVGNTSTCTISTTFQSNCGGDGEMSPYIRLTSVPYAFNASELGGVAASGFGQLAGTQSWTNTNTYSATGGNAIAITGAPTNTATSSLVQFGNAIAAGNTTANGGTYLGLNEPLSGAGSAADFLNFEVNGTSKLKVDNSGNITATGTVQGTTINATTGFTIGAANLNTAGTLSNVAYVTQGNSFTTGTNTFSATGGNSLAVTGAPTNTATLSLVRLGNAISGGNVTANGGTYLGINEPVSGAGSVADFFNFQNNNTSELKLSSAGALTENGGLTINSGGFTVTGNSTLTGTLGGLTGLTVASGGLTITTGGATITGNSTLTGTLTGLTGVTIASGGLTITTGGATITGNSTITGTLGGLTGLTVASGGASITGNSTIAGTLGSLTGLTLASGNLSNAGTYNGNTFTASGLTFSGASANTITGAASQSLTIASGTSGQLILSSTNGTLGLSSATSTIQRIGTGITALDLDDSSATTLQLGNSGTGTANLNLLDGDLETGGTPTIRLDNAGNLTNIGTIGATGLATLSGGLTLTGATSIDATGTANTAIGNGTGTFSLNSSALDVSTLGAISGVTTIGLSGAITGATATNTINGLIINSGAVSGATTLGLSGAITGATTTNTINGLIINSGALSGITTLNASGLATLSGGIQVGSATTDGTQTNLQLDSYNTYADSGTCSTSTNQGALYYNTSSNAIRTCLNGNWEDLVSTSGLGIILFGVVPDSTPNLGSAGDLAGIGAAGANGSGPCKVYIGSTTSKIRWTSCIAYSGGRKIVVAAQTTDFTIPLASSTTQYDHICLNGAGGNQPVSNPAAAGNGAETANLPAFSANNPILCIADVLVGTAAISDIYDVRTYTTSIHDFVDITATASVGLGTVVIPNATTGSVTAGVSAVGNIEGVIDAWGGAIVGTPNAIISVAGPVWAKATAGTAGAVVVPSATAGRVATSAGVAGPYGDLGLQRSITWSATCTAGTASTCQESDFFNMQLR